MRRSIVFNIPLLFFMLVLIACTPESTHQPINNIDKLPSSNIDKLPSSNQSSQALSSFFDKEEQSALIKIKQVFDKKLSSTFNNKDIAYIYKDHASRMRMDYFNKFPYTLNFPYNDKFDLSEVKEEVSHLTFLTDKCGFQKEDGTAIHYYCLKREGTFMNLMEALGIENSLIKALRENYQNKKTITPEIKQQLIMDSVEQLDFQKVEHQVVYMFYQILINEERLAANKLSS